VSIFKGRAALESEGIAVDPTKLDRPTPSSTSYEYHLQQYGVWVFFDDRLLINGLRFDKPFAGKIGGVAIGDDQAAVRRAKGEPSNQFRGLPDKDALEDRQQRRLDILNALPDPAPKERVMAAFREIARIDALPLDWNTAWTYNPAADKQSFFRYDFSATSGKVQSILANSCHAEG
jgi:hypothetical protein